MPIKKKYITLLFAFFFLLFPNLIDAKQVYLGGENVGIEISNEGLLISGTYDIPPPITILSGLKILQ